MAKFFKQKNRFLIIGAIVGVLFSLLFLGYTIRSCGRIKPIINRGSIPFELGDERSQECINAFSPTFFVKDKIEIFLHLDAPIRGANFFVLHIGPYPLIGLFIGWIIYKVKQRRKKS